MPWNNWRGPELIASVSGGLQEAVKKTCHVILEVSNTEVPHDEGTLMLSGIVLMAPDGSPEGCISYGGGPGTGHPVVPYAIRWHENSANFQKGRKRFYLRDPMNRLGAITLQKAIAAELGRRL